RSRSSLLHLDRERQARRGRSTHVFAGSDQRRAAWRTNPTAARNALSATRQRSTSSIIQDGGGRVGTFVRPHLSSSGSSSARSALADLVRAAVSTKACPLLDAGVCLPRDQGPLRGILGTDGSGLGIGELRCRCRAI